MRWPSLLLILLLSTAPALSQQTLNPNLDSPDYKTFQAWVAKTMVYPEVARKNGIQGTVHVQFFLDESYHVIPESIKIFSGLTASCDEEALRVMKLYKGTFQLSQGQVTDRSQRWIVPFHFVLKHDSRYATQGPDHKLLKRLQAVVASKGLKKGYPNWPVYPNPSMDLPMKSVAPGDTVEVIGWSAWSFYVSTKFIAGFISYKALESSPRLDSLVEQIQLRSLEEEAIVQKEKPRVLEVTAYDTARVFVHPDATFNLSVDKQSLMLGECTTISASFHVYERNKLPIEFIDLGIQVEGIRADISRIDGQTLMNEIVNVNGEPKTDGIGKFFKYEVYRSTWCPSRTGTIVVPAQKLKMIVAKNPRDRNHSTVVTFASSPQTFYVRPLPKNVSVTTFHDYKMVGLFQLREATPAGTVRVGEKFQYTVEIESTGPTFMIEPPCLGVEGLRMELSEIKNQSFNGNKLTSKKFIYHCLATKEGVYDFTDQIKYRCYDPVADTTMTLRSKAKIKVEGSKSIVDQLDNEGRFFTKNFIIAIDVSQSMMIEDYRPSRLEAVKQALKKFASKRDMCEVGILFFGGDVKHLDNRNACFLESAIDSLSYKDVSSGTAIGDAVFIGSISARKDINSKLIVIGDGDNTAGQLSPSYAARVAKQKGVRIYTIGVGHRGEVQYGKDFFGRPILISDTFNDRDFKLIANETGGQYFWAEDSNAILEALERVSDH